MSLVEQAAQRLEQLRKAGQQIGSDLETPAPKADRVADSLGTIERAAKQIEDLHSDASNPVQVEPVARPSQTASPSTMQASNTDLMGGQQVQAKSPLSGAPRHQPSGRRARVAEIDVGRLAARGLLTPDAPQSRLANELRVIKRPLINNCLGKGASAVKNANRIMITSAMPGEGKSYVSINLAMSIAMERDSTVLLVEGDPTRPTLADSLGISASRGLMDLLVDPKLDVGDVLIRTNIGRLTFIPAGTRQEHATELLASVSMEALVDQLATRYSDRILIFDSPPLLAAPEPRVLARYMGQIIFVVEAEQTSQGTAMEALSTIESCPVVMTVLNKATAHQESNYYYYYSNAGAD